MPSDGVDGAQDGIPRDAVSKGFSLSEVLLISVGEGDISCPQLHVIPRSLLNCGGPLGHGNGVFVH